MGKEGPGLRGFGEGFPVDGRGGAGTPAGDSKADGEGGGFGRVDVENDVASLGYFVFWRTWTDTPSAEFDLGGRGGVEVDGESAVLLVVIMRGSSAMMRR